VVTDERHVSVTPTFIRERVTGFISHLRLNDFDVGMAQSLAVLNMLASGGLGDAQQSKRKLKIFLSSSKQQWDDFDALFEAYWYRHGRARAKAQTTSNPQGPNRPAVWQDHFGKEPNAPGHQSVPQIESEQAQVSGEAAGRLIASNAGNHHRTDLRHVVDPEAMRRCEQLAFRLARSIRYRLSRRYRVRHQQRQLDLRRTLRANMSHGGEPFTLIHKSPPQKPVRIIVFLDVSGSMKHYSRFFLQFVKGLVGSWFESDVYLVHTRLVRVTETLRQQDAMVAMSRLALIADGFGGGTRLGDCLQTFNRQYAKSAVNSRTVAFVMSDGYDTGDCRISTDETACAQACLAEPTARLATLRTGQCGDGGSLAIG